ncbi:MAG TPA: hypothetical protein VGQ26_09610 [Streptosporangiaceae bacterium]|jgi:hypothetical protein|nr:hypothetical protein [Streptosporangiaceae bacterium]
MPKEARADPGVTERRPQPRRVGGRQLDALDQKAAGFLGAHLRRLLDVRVHDLGERGGGDGILIGGINFWDHAPHDRPDHISGQPRDPVAGEQALRQRGLPHPRCASHQVDDVPIHTGILLGPGPRT